jgi:hypothetical protein
MGARNSQSEKRRPYSEWNEMKKGLRSIKFTIPHMLSHHPHCKYYDKDVLHIGKWKFCWGCIVAYPVMVICMFLIIILGLTEEFSWWEFILAGMIFGSFELISLWRKGRGLRHRIIKFFLGIGLALMIIGVILIPIHIGFRILIFVHLYFLAGFLGSFRIRAMETKCKKCKWKGNWNRCPGFEEMNSRLEREGLLVRK